MRTVAAALRDRGFTHTAIVERLGIADHRQNHTPRLAKRLGELAAARVDAPLRDGLDALVQLLVLNSPVGVEALRDHVGATLFDALEDTGLVQVAGEQVTAQLTLTEWNGLLIASDTMWQHRDARGVFGAGAIPIDAVLNPIFDSYAFAATLPARPAATCLDLCTGSGVVALHASRTHREVLGIDIAPRSVAFARFNAALNGISNVSFVEGDLFAGIDEQFDTLAANPPYMPTRTPPPGASFWAGGENGDALTTAILRGLPTHLAGGGYAHLVGFFLHRVREGRTLVTPDLARLAPGCDVVFHTAPVPFRDRSIVSPSADFGDAVRVDYGAYTLRRRRDDESPLSPSAPR